MYFSFTFEVRRQLNMDYSCTRLHYIDARSGDNTIDTCELLVSQLTGVDALMQGVAALVPAHGDNDDIVAGARCQTCHSRID